MEFFGIIFAVALAVAIYFIPTWVASARNHHNTNAILATNLLVGWTFVGWVVALIWACTEVKSSPNRSSAQGEVVSATDTKKCPMCAETIKTEAIKCRYCGSDLTPEVIRPLR